MGKVHSSKGVLTPVSDQLLSEVEIICRLAKATIPEKEIAWNVFKSDYNIIRSKIEAVIPGFDNYNKRVEEDGFYLPNVAREGKFIAGKANFTIADASMTAAGKGEYIMMTVRSHDQFNTTIYGLDDRYRGIYQGRKIVLMHPDDIQEAGLKSNDIVDLSSDYDKVRTVTGFTVVAYNIPKSCIGTYFPEANPLIPISEVAEQSNTPVSKGIIVKLSPVKNL